jgi:Chalcone isomerase-like
VLLPAKIDRKMVSTATNSLKEGFIKQWPSFVSMCLSCALVMFIIIAPCVTYGAVIDDLQVPDTIQVDGKTLHLNGYGLRTYSILGIHIYVASLYLEHLSTNPAEIIQSPETKLLIVRFEHSVSVDEARKAWHDGLANNCKSPCRLDPTDVEKFLAVMPAMHVGDNYSLLFRQHSATVTVSGQRIGTINSPQFAEAMLATFLGPNPASPSLKRELLRGHG